MTRSLVQSQFGANAAAYATSDVHAAGESLKMLVGMSDPQPHWAGLDVATGAVLMGPAREPLHTYDIVVEGAAGRVVCA